MAKTAKKLLLLPLLFLLLGCPPLEQSARDTIASSSGFLTSIKPRYAAQCKASPTDGVCTAISKAISAQNVAIDALEIYCSGIPAGNNPPFGQGGPCAVDNSAAPKLQQALGNLNQTVNDVKGLVKK